MAVLHRVRSVISGTLGGPYLSTMFFDGTNGAASDAHIAVHTFWTGVKGAMGGGAQIDLEDEVAQIDSVTGALLGVEQWVSGGMAGTAGGELLPRQTQLLVRWGTDGIVGGRRIRGRTFIPSLTEVNNSAGGVPSSDALIWADGAGTNLIADPTCTFVVWRRPKPATATAPAVAGAFAEVTGVSTWDQWATLNSRRD